MILSHAGQILTLWTIRAAAILYVFATTNWLTKRDARARIAWSLGCALFVVHVAAAFHFVHAWSHARAYDATAQQTRDVFGIHWGGGLYFNYVFALLWIVDTIWWWSSLAAYRSRSPWIGRTIHTFMAFMFFNATVVFAHGATRWFGLAATLLLIAICLRERNDG